MVDFPEDNLEFGRNHSAVAVKKQTLKGIVFKLVDIDSNATALVNLLSEAWSRRPRTGAAFAGGDGVFALGGRW